MNTENITCDCGRTFARKIEEDEWFRKYQPTQCPECIQKDEDAREEVRRIEREKRMDEGKVRLSERIASETPPRYRGTDTAHPSFNARLWAKVRQWRPTEEAPWLGLVGSSGTCKTRCSFLLLHQLVMESVFYNYERRAHCSATYEIATAYDITESVMAQYRDGARGGFSDTDPKVRARRFLDRLATTEILILDDFGKARNTPSYTSEIFAILDHRHAHNLTTIWTANSKPEDLVQGMGEDMAGPLAGRLIECSNTINCG